MGTENIAVAVSTEQQARETVRTLIDGGAVVIKVALEPGGEAGAPWASGYHHAEAGHETPQRKAAHSKKTWPLLSEDIVKAIVDEAHKQDRKVTVHLGEAKGAKIAIDAGIDEWRICPVTLFLRRC